MHLCFSQTVVVSILSVIQSEVKVSETVFVFCFGSVLFFVGLRIVKRSSVNVRQAFPNASCVFC